MSHGSFFVRQVSCACPLCAASVARLSREVYSIYLGWFLYARYGFRTSIGLLREVLCEVRFPYLDCFLCARYVFRTSIDYTRGVMRGTFSVPRLALPCSKTKYDCTAIFLPSNLTLDIKSAEIMCCTHILILSSKGIHRVIIV